MFGISVQSVCGRNIENALQACHWGRLPSGLPPAARVYALLAGTRRGRLWWMPPTPPPPLLRVLTRRRSASRQHHSRVRTLLLLCFFILNRFSSISEDLALIFFFLGRRSANAILSQNLFSVYFVRFFLCFFYKRACVLLSVITSFCFYSTFIKPRNLFMYTKQIISKLFMCLN